MEHPLRKVLALADAELSPPDVPALVQELARNPSLVRALQSYLAVGRNRIAKAYTAKSEEPVPAWLVETVMQAPLGNPASPSFKVVSFGRTFLDRLKDKYRMPGWSLAAGPALAAVLAALSAWLLVPNASQSETLLTSQLQHAIETTGGGQEAPLLTFRPMLTFLSKDHTYCRQFEVRAGKQRSYAVACREPAGGWHVAMESPPFPVGTAPASSGREQHDRFVEGHMLRPLDKEEAERAQGGGWLQRLPAPEAAKP